MRKELKPTKLGDVYKLIINSNRASPNGVQLDTGRNSFKFNVNFSEMTGDVVRCAVKEVIYPPPATYIPRRLWFADGNTFFKTYTDPQTNPAGQKVNDYETLFTKYGINNFMYMYYPARNIYMRLFWNNIASGIVRQTLFSVSTDGINWSGNGNLSNFGMVFNVEWSGAASVPFDFYEIDTTITPRGNYVQNIHCPQLTASRSYTTTTQTPTDIIGHVNQVSGLTNPYTLYDVSTHLYQRDLGNEILGETLRGTTSIDIYFTRVATPTVKEFVPLPWSIELAFYCKPEENNN